MRPIFLLPLLAGLLVACGRVGGDGNGAAAGSDGRPGQSEAASGAPARASSEPAMPFGPRSAARRAQDSVLRTTGSRHRRNLAADSSEAERVSP